MVDLFDGLALHRDIHLEFIDHSDDDITLLDSDKVEKIMVNLLSNAFKFTPEGSSITVELSTVKASERNLSTFYDSYFEIIVEDTGAGISKETIDLIFDKYYTTGTGVPGTHNSGIGLYYVKDLIYLMQGEIKVDSQLGKGTKFIIYLPKVLKKDELSKGIVVEKPALKMAREEASLLMGTLTEEAALSATDHTENNAKLPRILVVEDNPDMQHFLDDILSKYYQVGTANNGLEGLKMARNQSFDLILSDVMMPEMDGIAFCKKIKENFATSHLPVILLTAKALEESKLDGYIKGADDYITKPFNPELLLVRVKNLLQQREQLRKVFNKNFMLTPKTEMIASPDEEFLARLVNLMNENLSEAEFNVKSMCQSMHLSHMHFIRKVKQLTGKKPIDLLKSFRMKKAKDLLMQQKLTIAEVAYMVGFDLPNSFSRSFKKEFDLTPTEFVKNISEVDEDEESKPPWNVSEIHSIEQ
jgi:DNA-binding response OmpR family regulator